MTLPINRGSVPLTRPQTPHASLANVTSGTGAARGQPA